MRIASQYTAVPSLPWSGGVRLAFDLESDGLLDTAARVHCVVIGDLDSGEIFQYGPDRIAQALEHLARAQYLVGHNIQQFDLPLLRKLYDWSPAPGAQIVDTLICSRLIFPGIDVLDDQAAAIAKATEEPRVGG